MPTYEFHCKKCGHRFSLVESLDKHDKHREKCPKCKSTSLERVLSAVSVKTSRKT